MKRTIFPFFILLFVSSQLYSQLVTEFGIKPTEWIWLNFETYAGIGTKKARYGILLSYRPSTQNSGEVHGAGTGAAGGYGHRFMNNLYNSYTLGLYQKTYLNESQFLEADIFYRNWYFKNKQGKYDNVEGYRFDGPRTENVNVYGLKLLFGETFILTHKKRRYRPYFDLYFGAGIRRQKEMYETFNGYVGDVYYDYKKDVFYHTWVTPQAGIKFGFVKTK